MEKNLGSVVDRFLSDHRHNASQVLPAVAGALAGTAPAIREVKVDLFDVRIDAERRLVTVSDIFASPPHGEETMGIEEFMALAAAAQAGSD